MYKVLKSTLKTCSEDQGQCSFHSPASGSYHDCHLNSSILLWKFTIKHSFQVIFRGKRAVANNVFRTQITELPTYIIFLKLTKHFVVYHV